MGKHEQAVIDAAMAWYRCWNAQSEPPSVEAGQDAGEVPLWDACVALEAANQGAVREKLDVVVTKSGAEYFADSGNSHAKADAASEAVRRLAEYLWGPGKHGRACMGLMENGIQRWQIMRGAV